MTLDTCEVCGLPFIEGELVAVSGVQWPRIRARHEALVDCVARIAIVARAAAGAS